MSRVLVLGNQQTSKCTYSIYLLHLQEPQRAHICFRRITRFAGSNHNLKISYRRRVPSRIRSMGRLYICLHEWLISMVNVAKYTKHGCYGIGNKLSFASVWGTSIFWALRCFVKMYSNINCKTYSPDDDDDDDESHGNRRHQQRIYPRVCFLSMW